MGEEEPNVGYNCVFLNQSCPVRAVYKLRPESLVEFCKTCPLIKDRTDAAKTNDNRQTEMIFNAVQIAATQLEAMFARQHEERKRLLDLVEKLALAKV